MANIVIDDGLKRYDITDSQGNVRGQICFNPSDINFIPRANKAKAYMFQLIEEVKDKEVSNEDELSSALEDIDTKIKAELNRLFDDENLSKVVFGNKSCLTLVNDMSLIEVFFDAITPFMEEAFKEAEKASIERIEAYTKQV